MTLDTAPPSAEDPEASAEKSTDERDDDGDASHLDDLEDGAGCTEIWEKLSEGRD
ncbi:hypothetical protein [Halorubrum pallidum]|uniref:Uncharacterized protein n=1 Tax=Halorubrum pallidum TaxID=1526114 RepID=A0ABD5T1K9_9EURY